MISFFSKKYKDSLAEFLIEKLKENKLRKDIKKDIELTKEKNKLESLKLHYYYKAELYLEKYEKYPPESDEAKELLKKLEYYTSQLMKYYHKIEDLKSRIKYLEKDEEEQDVKVINMINEFDKKKRRRA